MIAKSHYDGGVCQFLTDIACGQERQLQHTLHQQRTDTSTTILTLIKKESAKNEDGRIE